MFSFIIGNKKSLHILESVIQQQIVSNTKISLDIV